MNQIICPRCRMQGNINSVNVMTNAEAKYKSYIVSCNEHSDFEFIGNIEALSLDSAKKENFAGLKRHLKLSINLSLVGLARGLEKVSEFMDSKLTEDEEK